MDSISTLKLPLIDLSKLDGSKPGTGQWDSLQSQVREALEEFGCFEVLTDKMTLEFHNDVFQELEALLELPIDVKCRFNVPDKPHNGYSRNLPHSPLQEAFGMNYTPNSGSIEEFANLMWPEGNTRFW
ncbi:hypothetical protein ACJRO7_007555 [Eucalyptus globulus]|uniref:Non-haem dioxygenase N-terminal domain-containing protein n=1 Tax=Eucalyptus globulus TaxID=34317 RepID=A0ABD3ILG3_EUCGL